MLRESIRKAGAPQNFLITTLLSQNCLDIKSNDVSQSSKLVQLFPNVYRYVSIFVVNRGVIVFKFSIYTFDSFQHNNQTTIVSNLETR